MGGGGSAQSTVAGIVGATSRGVEMGLPDLPPDWPNREASLCVQAGGLRWHVQRMGRGPVLLLLHGTGAATNSWRDLLPLLASDFTVVAPDLPGHGFTAAMPEGRSRLPDIAHVLAELLRALALAPDFIVGHSAGAAVSAQMALSETTHVVRLAWLAGAMRPLEGLAGTLGSPLARVLSRSKWLTGLMALRAAVDRVAVRRWVDGTGSRLDERGLATYGLLLGRRAHLAGALAMMAGWDLHPLQRAWATFGTPVLLLHGDRDRMVPARQSDELGARLPAARVEHLPGLGHLAHEEKPMEVAQRLRDWLLRGL